jgi:outer membrane protein assembly factor BamE (lipoprotein component of BamABCDE complex)
LALSKTIKNVGKAVIIALFLLQCFGMLVHYFSDYPWKEEEAQLKRIKIGMSEKQVLIILGEPPTWTFTAKDNKDYYIPGHSFKKRNITNKVLLFVEGDMILYVWFNKEGFVEDTFLARS